MSQTTDTGMLIPMKAPPQIFGTCDWLHMGQAYTIVNTAEVIDIQSIGDRTTPVLIGPTMRQDESPIEPELAVAVTVFGPCPQPTAAWDSIRERAVLVDHGQEASPSRLTFTLINSTRHGLIVSHSASVGHQQLAPVLVGCRASHTAGGRREPNKRRSRRGGHKMRQPILSAARRAEGN